jgi:spermidine synthase
LFVNEVPSSFLDLLHPQVLGFEYFQQMDAVLASTHLGPVSALHLGGGGCALARAWEAQRPGSRQIAVDIDGQLLAFARNWFALPKAPALRTRTQDALQAVQTSSDSRFDVVVRDVFSGNTTPVALTTGEFMEDVARCLKPDGLYLANCADRPPLQLAKGELAAMANSFAHLAAIAEVSIFNGKRYGNVVLAATNADDDPLTSPTLARHLRSLPVPAGIKAGVELASWIS